MTRTTLAAVMAAALTAIPAAGACTAPYEEMPFDLWSYGKHPRIRIHAGQCVIDPGFWTYTPPPRVGPFGRPIPV